MRESILFSSLIFWQREISSPLVVQMEWLAGSNHSFRMEDVLAGYLSLEDDVWLLGLLIRIMTHSLGTVLNLGLVLLVCLWALVLKSWLIWVDWQSCAGWIFQILLHNLFLAHIFFPFFRLLDSDGSGSDWNGIKRRLRGYLLLLHNLAHLLHFHKHFSHLLYLSLSQSSSLFIMLFGCRRCLICLGRCLLFLSPCLLRLVNSLLCLGCRLLCLGPCLPRLVNCLLFLGLCHLFLFNCLLRLDSCQLYLGSYLLSFFDFLQSFFGFLVNPLWFLLHCYFLRGFFGISYYHLRNSCYRFRFNGKNWLAPDTCNYSSLWLLSVENFFLFFIYFVRSLVLGYLLCSLCLGELLDYGACGAHSNDWDELRGLCIDTCAFSFLCPALESIHSPDFICENSSFSVRLAKDRLLLIFSRDI